MGVIKLGDRAGEGGQALVDEEGITCPKYRQLPGSKRCQHYAQGGGCALATEFMCSEWAKLNDPELYERQHESFKAVLSRTSSPNGPSGPAAAPQPPGGLTAASGPRAAQRPAEGQQGATRAVPVGGGAKGELPPRFGTLKSHTPEELVSSPCSFGPELISDDALAQLERSGLEVEVSSTDMDSIWLVPAFTDLDRPELTYKMARTLLVIMSIFPGAALRAVRRRTPNHKGDRP